MLRATEGTQSKHGRLYNCTQCRFISELLTMKTYHIACHLLTAQAPYHCLVCKGQYNSMDKLQAHVRTGKHHASVLLRPGEAEGCLGRSEWALNLEGPDADCSAWSTEESHHFRVMEAQAKRARCQPLELHGSSWGPNLCQTSPLSELLRTAPSETRASCCPAAQSILSRAMILHWTSPPLTALRTAMDKGKLSPMDLKPATDSAPVKPSATSSMECPVRDKREPPTQSSTEHSQALQDKGPSAKPSVSGLQDGCSSKTTKSRKSSSSFQEPSSKWQHTTSPPPPVVVRPCQVRLERSQVIGIPTSQPVVGPKQHFRMGHLLSSIMNGAVSSALKPLVDRMAALEGRLGSQTGQQSMLSGKVEGLQTAIEKLTPDVAKVTQWLIRIISRLPWVQQEPPTMPEPIQSAQGHRR